MPKISYLFFLFFAAPIPELCKSQSRFVQVVYFNTGDFAIRNTTLSLFQKIPANALHCSIKGHTDTVGSTSNNQTLSQKRTLAAFILLQQFHPQLPLDTASFGETLPISTNNAGNRRVELEFTLAPVSVAKRIDSTVENNKPGNVERIIRFHQIFFYPNQAVVRPESMNALQELYVQVKKLPNKKIEIRGHINWPLNSFQKEVPAAYKPLSEQRAKTVYLYLLEKGIDPKRLRYVGMENKEMLYPLPANNYEMQQNMRVELVLLKEE